MTYCLDPLLLNILPHASQINVTHTVDTNDMCPKIMNVLMCLPRGPWQGPTGIHGNGIGTINYTGIKIYKEYR